MNSLTDHSLGTCCPMSGAWSLSDELFDLGIAKMDFSTLLCFNFILMNIFIMFACDFFLSTQQLILPLLSAKKFMVT